MLGFDGTLTWFALKLLRVDVSIKMIIEGSGAECWAWQAGCWA